MATGVSSSDQNRKSTWPSLTVQLPLELDLRIFSSLKRSELFKAMLTCKNWLSLAQNSCFWEREFAVVGLRDQPNFPLLSLNVRLLIELSQNGERCLQQQVKTAEEFDGAFINLELAAKRRKESEKPSDHDTLIEEFAEKARLHEIIRKGFSAAIQLNKLRLKPLDDLEKYASALLERYGDIRGWCGIVNLHIEQNNAAGALELIDSKLQKKYEKRQFIEAIIIRYCHAKKFQDALDLLKRYAGDKYAEFFDAPRMILGYANETKDLVMIETVIDQVASSDWKRSAIINLISACLDVNQHEKAAALVIKYKTDLDQVDRYQMEHIFEIYVRLNQIENAWSLARKNNEDKLVFYFLRNAFLKCDLQDEVEKVNKLLPKED